MTPSSSILLIYAPNLLKKNRRLCWVRDISDVTLHSCSSSTAIKANFECFPSRDSRACDWSAQQKICLTRCIQHRFGYTTDHDYRSSACSRETRSQNNPPMLLRAFFSTISSHRRGLFRFPCLNARLSSPSAIKTCLKHHPNTFSSTANFIYHSRLHPSPSLVFLSCIKANKNSLWTRAVNSSRIAFFSPWLRLLMESEFFSTDDGELLTCVD